MSRMTLTQVMELDAVFQIFGLGIAGKFNGEGVTALDQRSRKNFASRKWGNVCDPLCFRSERSIFIAGNSD